MSNPMIQLVILGVIALFVLLRDGLRPFLADDVYDSFDAVISEREKAQLNIDATFIGLREIKLTSAEYDWRTGE